MNSLHSAYWSSTITIGLPYFTMIDRFGEQNGETADIITKLLELPHAEEVCLNHQCWIQFSFDGEPEEYPEAVKNCFEAVEDCLVPYLQQLTRKEKSKYTNLR